MLTVSDLPRNPRCAQSPLSSGLPTLRNAVPDLDIPETLKGIDAAAYLWTIGTDRLDWSPGLPASLSTMGAADTGAAWTGHTDPEAMTTRASAVFGSTARDDGKGVPYELE